MSTLEDGADTELTVIGNNGVSRSMVQIVYCLGNIGVSTLDDGADTELRAL